MLTLVIFISFFSLPCTGEQVKKFIFHKYPGHSNHNRDGDATKRQETNPEKDLASGTAQGESVASGNADAQSQGKAASMGKSLAESLIGSLSGSESQSFSKIKVKTKLSTSSNAQANSSVAARVKTYAHANTQTKVKTNQGVGNNDNSQQPPVPSVPTVTNVPIEVTTIPPTITRPPKAFWSPSYEIGEEKTTTTPTTTTPSGTTEENVELPHQTTEKPSSTQPSVICVPCPYPCPMPVVCPCPCSAPTTEGVIYCPIECAPPNPPPVLNLVQLPCDPSQSWLPACKRRFQNGSSSSFEANKENFDNITTKYQQHKIYSHNPFVYQHAAVAADHYLCSEMGKNILKKGGSAIDAIITTHLCVEIVNGHSTGLGGGGFMVCNLKDKNDSFTIDFRETLPSHYDVNKSSINQGDLILVPGVLKGLHRAHQLAGHLSWKELFKEPIKLAKKGFRIHEALSKAIDKKKDFILTNLGLREIYAPAGYLLKQGNILKRIKLANTYKKIADSGGSDIFYKGAIADQIIEDIKMSGGSMTKKDLEKYDVIVRKPIKATIANKELLTVGPPASGVTVALMLKIMENFKWNIDQFKLNPGKIYHQIVEAMKFAYAPSSYLSDPRFVDDVDELVKFMLDPKTAKEMSEYVDDTSHVLSYYGPFTTKAKSPPGTSHMSVVAPNGDSCSLTSSINAYFGSKIASRQLGFFYNNELSDFGEFWPQVYNLTRDDKLPGKRPMSKVAPMIFLDKKGNPDIVIGAAGGYFIPTALATTLAHYLFLNENITTAVARPRLHCQLFPPTVVYEDTFPDKIVPLLKQYNHQLVINDTFSVSGQQHAIMGVIQAIVKNPDGRYEAVCDYRKGGLPSGF